MHRGNSGSNFARVLNRTRQRGTRTFDKITFIVANTIPGYAYAPIITGSSVGRSTVMFDCTVLAVLAHFRTPPVGSDIVLDIKLNGATIFDSNKLVYPADDILPHRYTNFHTRGLRMYPSDEVSLDVVQVGSDFGGCDGQIVILLSVLRTS